MLAFLCSAPGAGAETARILRFDKNVVDLGTVKEDASPVTVIFEGVNISDKPVQILDVMVRCRCVNFEFERKAVAPGQKVRIKATFNPKNLFAARKEYLTVVATNGDYKKFSTLQIKAYVDNGKTEAEVYYPHTLSEKLRMDLPGAGFKMRNAGEKPSFTITLFNDSDKAVKLGWKSSRRVSCDMGTRIDPHSKMEVTIIYDTSGMKAGEWEDAIHIWQDGKQIKDIKLKGAIK
ncbi:MAG: DUF1573 domain-containing protein [Bacteroidales bacterium]|nr:DUF1573 domain-containing protein [Bacteroidales bacterium]